MSHLTTRNYIKSTKAVSGNLFTWLLSINQLIKRNIFCMTNKVCQVSRMIQPGVGIEWLAKNALVGLSFLQNIPIYRPSFRFWRWTVKCRVFMVQLRYYWYLSIKNFKMDSGTPSRWKKSGKSWNIICWSHLKDSNAMSVISWHFRRFMN